MRAGSLERGVWSWNGSRKRQLFGGDLFDHGEDVVEEAVPGFDFAEAGALEFGIGGVVIDNGTKFVEMGSGAVEMRFDAQTEEAAGQTAHVQLRAEVLFAHTGQEDALDGPDLPQPLEPLEGAAPTRSEQRHNFVEVERPRCAEKQPIDLADGARQRKGHGRADKERDGLLLERREHSKGGVGHGDRILALLLARFAGKLPPLVKTRSLADGAMHEWVTRRWWATNERGKIRSNTVHSNKNE